MTLEKFVEEIKNKFPRRIIAHAGINPHATLSVCVITYTTTMGYRLFTQGIWDKKISKKEYNFYSGVEMVACDENKI